MLDRCLKLTDVSYRFSEEDLPESVQAWANLEGHGIVKSAYADDENLTRGQAARMLTAAMAVSNR